ncbi:Glycopeptide [Mycena sanguinolenta]|uniref:Glycopeptide n=1 Tax=Mycena sanguinolenta TaxID=230812 RepID=A0A8H6Y4I3_9AGAR|nr:Glycopeptide [Mycena sanguinolenta]
MFSSIKAATLAMIVVAAGKALAESHTVTFENNCGFGTPTLIRQGSVIVGQGDVILSTGDPYTSDGPLTGAIAYLQTGSCGLNGENCTTVETTLVNPTSPGTGSISDITLVPPHAFSVPTGFGYLGACSGAGADCTSANCDTAFRFPTDHSEAVACEADDADLVILFCS